MNDAPDLEALVRDLCTMHGCHTVILYGSRAKGTHTAASDYDLVAFRDDGEPARDTRTWSGLAVDAWIYPESAARPVTEEFLRVRGGVVVREKGTLGRDLIADADALFAAGPKPLPEEEVHHWRAWFRRMLGRIREGGPDDVLAGYRRAWLLFELLPHYFALRDRFYLGPKESIAWLREHDEETFEAFREALRPSVEDMAVERLVERVERVDERASR